MKKDKLRGINIYIILSLISIDQLIKLSLYQSLDILANTNITLIPNYLLIKPKFNTDYSWLNSLFSLGLGKLFHVVLTVVILLLVILIYNFIRSKRIHTIWLDVMFICVISGTGASLIDRTLWPGSLDYILLKGYFIFDLKDIYISVFEIILVFMVGLHFRAINDFKLSNFKDYVFSQITKRSKRYF